MSERTREAMADFFDEWSEGYEDRFVVPRLRKHLIDRRMGPLIDSASPGKLFVEVGCGTGASMDLMPCESLGFDIAPGMLRQAAERHTVAMASGTDIPLEDNVADISSTQLVLHHVNFYLGYEGVTRIIRELVRITKPGGIVSILEANAYNPYWYFFMWRHGEDNAKLIRPPRLARTLGELSGGEPSIMYRGFLPEWLPERTVEPAIRIETLLERSPLKYLSANYLLVSTVRKQATVGG